ncbi:Protein of unknown function DUF247, plant [Dillenia turbinata]|uniref:Uncharacterized protein n=1 Tax=Dillenia turbinata TaxID=194707 RepID=A0AAN8VU62_9MAGN
MCRGKKKKKKEILCKQGHKNNDKLPAPPDLGEGLFHVDEGVADTEIELSRLRIRKQSNGICDGNSAEDVERVWLISMENGTKQISNLLKTSAAKISCSIFRVPPNLFENFEKFYRPKIVSIGPHHHGKDNFEMTEEHKWRFLGSFLARSQRNGAGLDKYFKATASIEGKIRDCYSETIDFNSHDFIKVVLYGCFIIELSCKVETVFYTVDLLCSYAGPSQDRKSDSFFFVLETIYSFLYRGSPLFLCRTFSG